MVKRFGKRLNGIALAVLILISCCVSALAAPSGSIRVVVQDSHSQPVRDINVELIQVAKLEGGLCTLEPGFEALGFSGEELISSLTPETAQTVYQYVYAHPDELEDAINIKLTSAEGIVEFSGLREGVYLVFEYGDQAVAFEPFLVTIPSQIGGRPEYQVISIPKTSETDVRTLVCMKVWEDDMNAAGKRPESLQVTVLRDGVPYRWVTLSAENSWHHKFYMLPDSGTYTVEEASVTDYTPEYIPVMEGCIIINRYTGTGQPGGLGGGGGGEEPDLTHVSVSKVWDDDNNAGGKRPDSITVQLIADNMVLQTAVLSEANQWKYTFYGLDGSKSYTVTEIAVPEFSASYSGNASTGIVITNRHEGTTDPGLPLTPTTPKAPEEPLAPIDPEDPAKPSIPQTGAEVLPVYLLMAAGVVLVLLGLVDLCRGRECYEEED